MSEFGTYIKFVEDTPKPKTKTWRVETRDEHGVVLGWVRWFASWRKYSYFPNATTVYEGTCLREIANFCEHHTNLHKQKVFIPKPIGTP